MHSVGFHHSLTVGFTLLSNFIQQFHDVFFFLLRITKRGIEQRSEQWKSIETISGTTNTVDFVDTSLGHIQQKSSLNFSILKAKQKMEE